VKCIFTCAVCEEVFVGEPKRPHDWADAKTHSTL